jgi:curved DNA-binding protein
MKYKDYYAILGVARDASREEINKAYRRLAR